MDANVYAPPQAVLEPNTKPCTECGALINKKAEICPQCGVRQKGRVSKVALLLLAFFFGGIGAHKFYLGKYVWGLLYLVFCWSGIPGLLALIEFVIYACTSEERLNEKYQARNGSIVALFAVLALVLVAVIGILAAIAIPAYNDYTQRARVSQVLIEVMPLREKVESFVANNGRLPGSSVEVEGEKVLELTGLARVSLEDNGLIVARFREGKGNLSDQTVEIAPSLVGEKIEWDCTGGTANPKLRPRECRSAH